MLKKIFFIFFISIFLLFCSKKEVILEVTPESQDQAFEVYNEAYNAMQNNDLFFAAKKFGEAELIMPNIEMAAQASIMSAFCLYGIRFYDDALSKLEIFKKKYPASKYIIYANYLSIISHYEQILDEKKDRQPLLIAKSKIEAFLSTYKDNDYSLDLKFKLDLINNQLAAKEMYVAKFYIKTKKWIPAINRLKKIVTDYQTTIFIEEALFRLVELHYSLGLLEESEKYASILGYNYNSSEWFEFSYKILNKNYEKDLVNKEKEINNPGIIKTTINKILNKN